MANISYLDMVNVVKDYYSGTTTPDAWVQFTRAGITSEQLAQLDSIGIHTTLSASGNVLGYEYAGTLPTVNNPLSVIDSNLQTGSYGTGALQTQIPGSAVLDPQTSVATMTSGLKSVATGSTVMSLVSDIGLAIGAVALGTKLGKAIDSVVYSLAPDFWDEHYPTVNPATWDDIITEDLEGAQLFRTVFGITDDDTTMYMDEKALAYTYAMLLQNGAWASGDTGTAISSLTTVLPQPIDFIPAGTHILTHSSNGWYVETYYDSPCFICDKGKKAVVADSANSSRWHTRSARTLEQLAQINFSNLPISLSSNYTYDNKTVYYTISGITNNDNPADVLEPNVTVYTQGTSSNNFKYDAWTIIYGTIHIDSSLPGVEENPNAGYQITPTTVINPTTGNPVTPQDNIDDILQALKLAFPQLFDGAIYEDVLQPDGTVDRHTYVPTPMPVSDTDGNPITDTTPGIDPQQNPEVNPENRTDPQLENLTESVTNDPTAPDTGSGTTPPFLPPDGTANALYAIYNPSQGELNSFGAWLWSSNFVDQLLKLFNDPMQAIIGLHKVFVNPVISGRQNIKVGYLDSGVASNVVGAQYVTVDCGSVTISEYFGNVFDYDPFTQIYLYLPFVGIQRLDTGDVMRGTLNVVYHCDVLTGACLVEVNVFRDGGGGIIYTYTGNCAVQYPISSGSYMGIIASLASVVGGVVGTIATGGALAPVALGAVSGVMNAHTRVEHSGGFSGNAGAMGIKKPYVIIIRPQTCLADNFPAFNGYPANKLTYIGECTGYIKCDECHIEQIPGTDAELSELENMLKSGIII